MNKSFNDIREQAERVIALAQERGRYCDNAKGRVDTQYIYQIAARTRMQHGIPLFGCDRDEKRPFIGQEPQPIEQPKEEEPKPTTPTVTKTPAQVCEDRTTMTEWMNADAAHRKQIQEACRHAFVRKMFAELLTDMTICQLEGWDVLEFPRMLKHEIERCFPKPVQLSLFK